MHTRRVILICSIACCSIMMLGWGVGPAAKSSGKATGTSTTTSTIYYVCCCDTSAYPCSSSDQQAMSVTIPSDSVAAALLPDTIRLDAITSGTEGIKVKHAAKTKLKIRRLILVKQRPKD